MRSCKKLGQCTYLHWTDTDSKVSEISHWFPKWWWERNTFNAIKRMLFAWVLFFSFHVVRLLKIWKIKQNFIAIAKWEFSKDCTKICLVGCYQRSVKAYGTTVISTGHCCIFLLVLEYRIPVRITDTLKNCCSSPAGTESCFRPWFLKDHLLPVDRQAQIKVNICAWIIWNDFPSCYGGSICSLPLSGKALR